MKTCTRCGATKSRSEFYAEKRALDGLRSVCKACHNEAVRNSRARNPEQYHERNRRYHRSKSDDTKRRHRQAWRLKYRVRTAERQRLYRAANPEKVAAWQAVRTAVENGTIRRADACERCGATADWLEASHDDYARPLDVEWLCARCHREKDGNLIGHVAVGGAS